MAGGVSRVGCVGTRAEVEVGSGGVAKLKAGSSSRSRSRLPKLVKRENPARGERHVLVRYRRMKGKWK